MAAIATTLGHAPDALAAINRELSVMDAGERVRWALTHLPATHVLSSSFGIQAAVMLHLVTRIQPDIPVILVDTGYLFPETYGFIDQLRERLQLNLVIARPDLSPRWMEARYGKLWEQGASGLDAYNHLAKVAPMRHAMVRLGACTWLSGIRRVQATSRAQTQWVAYDHDRWKVHPVVEWSNRDVARYLKRHHLPWHPLWEKGYVSVGDTHTSQPLQPDMRAEDTRFFGRKRECGLHLDV